jgi:hypothetical protein
MTKGPLPVDEALAIASELRPCSSRTGTPKGAYIFLGSTPGFGVGRGDVGGFGVDGGGVGGVGDLSGIGIQHLF